MRNLILIMLVLPIAAFGINRGRVQLAYDGTFNGEVIKSRPIQLMTYNHGSIHAVYTGAGTGGCQMEVSNDKENWVVVSGSFLALGDGNDFINKPNIASEWMRASCSEDGTSPITMKIYLGAK